MENGIYSKWRFPCNEKEMDEKEMDSGMDEQPWTKAMDKQPWTKAMDEQYIIDYFFLLKILFFYYVFIAMLF
jgi:hypothetical protein